MREKVGGREGDADGLNFTSTLLRCSSTAAEKHRKILRFFITWGQGGHQPTALSLLSPSSPFLLLLSSSPSSSPSSSLFLPYSPLSSLLSSLLLTPLSSSLPLLSPPCSLLLTLAFSCNPRAMSTSTAPAKPLSEQYAEVSGCCLQALIISGLFDNLVCACACTCRECFFFLFCGVFICRLSCVCNHRLHLTFC